MQIHEIILPSYIFIGDEIYEKFREFLEQRFSRPFFVTDKVIYDLYATKVASMFSSSTITVEEDIDKIAAEVKEKYDVIVGIGGGKSIDRAKLVASKVKIPYISFPTSASHDGIASPIAVIKPGKSMFIAPPYAIFVDMQIIMKAPKRLFIAGCGDLLAKINAVDDWKLAHNEVGEYYGGYAADLAARAGNSVIKNAKKIKRWEYEGLRNIVEGLISAGIAMSIARSSRPCSGSEHMFSHALDTLLNSPALHGEQCALGTLIMQYFHGKNWMFVRRIMRVLGLPTNAEEIGINERYLIKSLLIAPKIRDRYTILNKIKLNEKLAYEVLSLLEIIG